MDDHGTNDDFPVFFQRSFGPLVLFLMRDGATLEEAEDAAQESLCRAYRAWGQLQHPGAWIRVVASRIHVTSAVRARTGLEHLGNASWANADTPSAELALFIDEERLVPNLLRQLPHTQRHVMAWHYDGYTTAEIAAILQKTPETIRSHLRYARNRLKQFLLDSDDARRRWPPEELVDLVGHLEQVNDAIDGVADSPREPGTDPKVNSVDTVEGVPDLADRPPVLGPPSQRTNDTSTTSSEGSSG